MGRSKGIIGSVATLRGKSCFHHFDREESEDVGAMQYLAAYNWNIE